MECGLHGKRSETEQNGTASTTPTVFSEVQKCGHGRRRTVPNGMLTRCRRPALARLFLDICMMRHGLAERSCASGMGVLSHSACKHSSASPVLAA